jgi:hypothetical protein
MHPTPRPRLAATVAAVAVLAVTLPAASASADTAADVTARQVGDTVPNGPFSSELTIILPDDLLADDDVTLLSASVDGTDLGCPQTDLDEGTTVVGCDVDALEQTTDLTADVDVVLSDGTASVPLDDAEPLDLSPDLDLTVDLPDQAPGDDGPTVAGVEVANTGDTIFDSVTLSGDGCSPAPTTLDVRSPGDETDAACTVDADADSDVTVTATGTWQGPDGEHTATWDATDRLATASVTLSASDNGNSNTVPGGRVHLDVVAHNTGDVDLDTATITLDGAAPDGCDLGTVEPGARARATCMWDDLDQTFASDAPLTATFRHDGGTIDAETSTGLGPTRLDPQIDGTLDLPAVAHGVDGTATLAVDAPDDGDTRFTSVVATIDACGRTFELDIEHPGDADTADCDYTADVASTNAATIVATYPTASGDQELTAVVGSDGGTARLTLRPSADTYRLPTADGPTEVTFLLTATGGVPVTGVSVSSDTAGCGGSWTELPAGTTRIACDVEPNTTDVRLEATGTVGTSRVTHTSRATFSWYGITVDAHVDPDWDRTDLDVPVNIVVTNDGTIDVDAASVRTRPFEPGCHRQFDRQMPLEPGDSVTVACTSPPEAWLSRPDRYDQDRDNPSHLHAAAQARVGPTPLVATDPAELDLAGRASGAATTADDQPVAGVTVAAELDEPAAFETRTAVTRCPAAHGCGPVTADTTSGDDGRWRLDVPAGTYTFRLESPRHLVFADTGTSTLTLDDVEVLPGRGVLDDTTLDTTMAAHPNPALRLPPWALALIGGALLAATGVGGWRHARSV